MCICVYKPENVIFPSKKTLKTCFENNPDGAGYMFNYAGEVLINKGFKTFNDFWKSLKTARDKYGDNGAFVLHFRISTQAGTRQDCTHPFPLSAEMDDLRKLRARTDIGIAHNGIISLTSSCYNKTITYSDTMKFIADYLTLIIKNKDYYKDADKVALIERLTDGSRLCILDGDGKATLTGKWTEDKGCYYSNASYKTTKKATATEYGWSEADFKAYDHYEEYYNALTKKYDFDPFDCPLCISGDDYYCTECAHYKKCYGFDDGEVYGG